MISTIEATLEKTMLKLLIPIDIKNVSNVMTSDNRNVKYCNLQTVTIAGDEQKCQFFSHRSPHVKGNWYRQR